MRPSLNAIGPARPTAPSASRGRRRTRASSAGRRGLPRFRHHHHHRVRSGRPDSTSSSSTVSNAPNPTRPDGVHRPHLGELAAARPRVHPVPVALKGVDLAVVRDEAKRLRRSHVGNVLVEKREWTIARACEPRARQVRVEAGSCGGQQQALADHRATRRSDGKAPASPSPRSARRPDHVQLRSNASAACAAGADSSCRMTGMPGPRAGPGAARRSGRRASRARAARRRRRARSSTRSHASRARRARAGASRPRRRSRPAAGSAKSSSRAQERVGELQQDARAVAGLGVGALGAAVLRFSSVSIALEIVSRAGCSSRLARKATPQLSRS